MTITERAKKVYDELAKGWNTWDVSSVTAHVYLPTKLRLNIVFIVPQLSGYSGNSLWENIKTFGEHSIDGSYTEVDIKYSGSLYKIETSAKEEELAIRITPLKQGYGCFAAVEVSEIWGGKLDIVYAGDGVKAVKQDDNFMIRTLNKKADPVWNPITAHHIICKMDEVVYFTVNSEKNKAQIDEMLISTKQSWLDSTISAEGDLGEGLVALRRSLLWNTVYEHRSGRVITPVSRNWCSSRGESFGDYVIFGWDTFFAALQLGLISRKLAYAAMFSILEEITPEGMIPNFGSGTGASRDRSEPQVGTMCAWKLYLQFGDKWFIEECFDRLYNWNTWRFKERDLNGDGLLELASTPWDAAEEEEYRIGGECGKRQAAMWESGLDNSTMWDKAVFNLIRQEARHL